MNYQYIIDFIDTSRRGGADHVTIHKAFPASKERYWIMTRNRRNAVIGSIKTEGLTYAEILGLIDGEVPTSMKPKFLRQTDRPYRK